LGGFILGWVAKAAHKLEFIKVVAMGYFLFYQIATIILMVDYRTNIAAKFCAGDYNPSNPSPLSHKGEFLLILITCLKAILILILLVLCLCR